MKNILLIKITIYLFVSILSSCSKRELFEVRVNRLNASSLPPIPPIPPTNTYSNSPYIYLQLPYSWNGTFISGNSVYNRINFNERIFNSNSSTADRIDSLSILENNRNIINILDTINNGGFFHQEILHTWLPGPGWEYEWILQIYYAPRTPLYTSHPPTGRLTIRFR